MIYLAKCKYTYTYNLMYILRCSQWGMFQSHSIGIPACLYCISKCTYTGIIFHVRLRAMSKDPCTDWHTLHNISRGTLQFLLQTLSLCRFMNTIHLRFIQVHSTKHQTCWRNKLFLSWSQRFVIFNQPELPMGSRFWNQTITIWNRFVELETFQTCNNLKPPSLTIHHQTS